MTRKRAPSGSAPAEKHDEYGKNDSREVASRTGVAAWLRNAVPGTRVDVRYLDDDVDHERSLVWLLSPVHWFAVSPDGDCWVEDSSARSARDGPSGVECPVRCERGPGDHLLCRFLDDMGRENLLKLMTECRESADKEPFYTRTEAPSAGLCRRPPTSIANCGRWKDFVRV